MIKRKRIPASGRYPPSEKLYAPDVYIYIYICVFRNVPHPVIDPPEKSPIRVHPRFPTEGRETLLFAPAVPG